MKIQHKKRNIKNKCSEPNKLRRRITDLEDIWVIQENEIFELTCGFDPKDKMPRDEDTVEFETCAGGHYFGCHYTFKDGTSGWKVAGSNFILNEEVVRWWTRREWNNGQ